MGNTSARLEHEQNQLTTYPNYSFMVVKDDQRIHTKSRSWNSWLDIKCSE